MGISQLLWESFFAGHLSLSVVTMNNTSTDSPSAGTDHNVIPPTWERIPRKTFSSFKTQLKLEEDTEGFPLNPLWLKAKINPLTGLFSWAEHNLEDLPQWANGWHQMGNPQNPPRNILRTGQVRKLSTEMATVTHRLFLHGCHCWTWTGDPQQPWGTPEQPIQAPPPQMRFSSISTKKH